MKDIKPLFEHQERAYAKGQILLYQAEETASTFQIQEGYVKVYDINVDGVEKLLLILGPGDIYPLIWTFGASDTLLYFYGALTDTKVTVVDRRKLLAAVESDHGLTKELLAYFVNRNKSLMLRVECLEAANAKYKVAQVLSYLYESHASGSGNVRSVLPSLTHQDIANMAGLTRETASIQMKELENDRVISQTKKHLKINGQKLEDLR